MTGACAAAARRASRVPLPRKGAANHSQMTVGTRPLAVFQSKARETSTGCAALNTIQTCGWSPFIMYYGGCGGYGGGQADKDEERGGSQVSTGDASPPT